ncbi:nicotinate-nucleotide--dimethylbenzimidazole phosphoribosyltransferase [Haloechinothrix sp. LS1_15]|uniref:nicotinate-nucleotide--dimethylbenzimidazole phosphoribosyltransferase n=1 Tax=Haloechinothrix sp. LS1_15 TaxID=2652248 RepID=UPI00294B843F|nr:nicotinate-nucleotide--dimethylbenzimidazole phosphoribosyltransferase [Haloechinothrix sp. LS1_15]
MTPEHTGGDDPAAQAVTFDRAATPDEQARTAALTRAGPPLLSTPVPCGPPVQSARQATGHTHAGARGGARADGLGVLDELAGWIAACQGHYPPQPLARPRHVIFAADHGIAERGVSVRAAGSTAAWLTEPAPPATAMRLLRSAGDPAPRMVDIGLAGELDPHLADTRFRVCRSSRPIDVADALDDAEARAAVAAGRAIADGEIDSGSDLLLGTALGVGVSTPAAAIIAALTGTEPVAVTGRGSGIDDAAWMRKAAAVRDALRRARSVLADPVAVLRTVGGADIAALTGFLAQAAVRRTPVLLDGLGAAAAALMAAELVPGARAWWRPTHRLPEPAHPAVLDRLELEPVLELPMAAAAAPAALSVLVMATAAHADHGRAAPDETHPDPGSGVGSA